MHVHEPFPAMPLKHVPWPPQTVPQAVRPRHPCRQDVPRWAESHSSHDPVSGLTLQYPPTASRVHEHCGDVLPAGMMHRPRPLHAPAMGIDVGHVTLHTPAGK